MQRLLLGCVAIAAGVLLPIRRARAQDMVDGRWRGWLQEADEDSIRVSFAVQHTGKHILMVMSGRSGISYDMADIKVKNDVLTFDWAMGLNSFLFCRLTRRDGRSFEGTCNDRSPGETGKPVRVWMIMSPPDSAAGRPGG
ncbi:MAG TPA: hypothetical protein VGL65_05420 [Gemmatimonadales bacterium]